MNIEKERMFFERYEHAKKPFANKYSLFEVFTKDGLDEDEYDYIGKYVCSFMQEKWELWLKAINRKGYKLVPLEDTTDMWYEGNCVLNNSGSVSDIYKAMIGACDD